jgi:dephospho-CoA kinase
VSRDALSLEEAAARIGAQAPLAEKLARADFVIDNSDAQRDTLPARVAEVHAALLTRFGVHTS